MASAKDALLDTAPIEKDLASQGTINENMKVADDMDLNGHAELRDRQAARDRRRVEGLKEKIGIARLR
jgi:hypothetical protein